MCLVLVLQEFNHLSELNKRFLSKQLMLKNVHSFTITIKTI